MATGRSAKRGRAASIWRSPQQTLRSTRLRTMPRIPSARMIQEWQESVIAFRCGLKPADVIRLGGPAQWNCSDVKFSLAYVSVDELESPARERIESVPTRLTLTAEQVDAAIEGGRAGTLALPRLRDYLRDRVGAVP